MAAYIFNLHLDDLYYSEHMGGTAEWLGLTNRTLYRKLKESEEGKSFRSGFVNYLSNPNVR